MSKLNIRRLTNENEDGAPSVSGIATFSSTAFLVPPSGTTAQRPEFVQPGMIRFNTDGAHLEYYNGVEWTEVVVANNDLNGGNRGVFGGGRTPGVIQNTIDFVTISTLGNASDFGDLVAPRTYLSSSSSSTRGLWAGGYNPAGGDRNIIYYVTISSTGNAQDFGDLTFGRYGVGSLSNSTRSVFGSGFQGPAPNVHNIIDYVTIISTGNAVDFGDLIIARAGVGAFSSSTRGIFGGGYVPGTNYNVIDYITISTTGNATDFGDLTVPNVYSAGCSNSTRGLFAGGSSPTPGSPSTNIIEYVTIASTGNSQDFGDLTRTASQPGACSSSTRGIFGGGTDTDNTIDYVTILTTGNASDFGDLTQGRRNLAACSNGHGGL